MLDDENSSFVPLLIFIEKQVGEFSGGQNLMAGAGGHIRSMPLVIKTKKPCLIYLTDIYLNFNKKQNHCFPLNKRIFMKYIKIKSTYFATLSLMDANLQVILPRNNMRTKHTISITDNVTSKLTF